jgi:hypothetical protein
VTRYTVQRYHDLWNDLYHVIVMDVTRLLTMGLTLPQCVGI